jgi:hypothetical protein
MNATILDLLARSPRAALAADVAIRATLVLGAAAVAALALRRSSAAARHLAWCLGLGAALVMPVMSLALPGWDWRILPAAGDDGLPSRTSTAHSPAPRSTSASLAPQALDELALEEEQAPRDAAPATGRPRRPTVSAPIATPAGRWWRVRVPAPSWSWLWATWLAGALAILSTPLAGWIALRRLARDAGPYRIAGKQGAWPKGAVEQSVDLALTRGTLLRGKVIEEGTGRPIAGAVVTVSPAAIPRDPGRGMAGFAVTGADGTYRIAAPQEPCYLNVQSSDDYVLREINDVTGTLPGTRRRRDRLYTHGIRAIEVKPGAPDEFDFSLRRGVTVHGRVLDPEGRPVADAWFYSRIVLKSMPTGSWRIWYVIDDRDRGHVRDGRFTLHGLDPAVDAISVSFLEPDRKLGATARFSAKMAAAGEVTVRLEPCGRAMARLLGPDGKPLDRYPASDLVSMVATPGPTRSGSASKDGPLFAAESSVYRIDPVNFRADLESDAQGRVTFPALIPGASYRIVDGTPAFGGGEPVIRREFVVAAGEAVELGDVLIVKPRRRNGQ